MARCPRDHGQLVVNVDLIEGLNREAGDLGHRPGDPAQQVVVDTFEEMGVTSVFVPQFDGYTVPVHSCGPDEGECNVTVIFHFANSAYFSGEIPPPVEQVFALNAFTGDELSNDTQVFKKDTPCDGLMPNEKLPPQALDGQQKLNSTEDDFASGLSRTEDSDRFAYEDSDSSRREFSLPLFTPEQVSTCRFHGYLIQWKDKMEWPAVLCLQEQAGVTCFETNLRYR